MEKLKLGTIGCGRHASTTIHPSLIYVEEIDWVAACDINEERLQQTASLYNVKPYNDMNKMFQNEELDAILVIGPPSMHHEVGLEVLKAGYHLIVEKPPATSAKDAKELVDTAKAAGKMGAMSTHWRHSPAHRKMKEIMQRPEFGQPTFYEGRFHAWGPTGPGPLESIFLAYLFGQGVHLVDCTRFIMGDVAEVYAIGMEGKDGAIGMSVSVKFVNGAVGQLAMASAAPVLDNYIDVFGDGRQRVRVIDHDRLEYQSVPPWEGVGGYNDAPAQMWQSGNCAYAMRNTVAYIEEHRSFARALLAGKEPKANLEDGYQAMRVLEAMNESIKTGKPVKL